MQVALVPAKEIEVAADLIDLGAVCAMVDNQVPNLLTQVSPVSLARGAGHLKGYGVEVALDVGRSALVHADRSVPTVAKKG